MPISIWGTETQRIVEFVQGHEAELWQSLSLNSGSLIAEAVFNHNTILPLHKCENAMQITWKYHVRRNE